MTIEHNETRYREKRDYKEAVRDGFCPECGRSDLVRYTGMVLIICRVCNAHYSTEGLSYE